MKKSIVKIIVLLLVLTCFGTGMLSSSDAIGSDIDWIKSFDVALEKAGKENKKIFVLITAPSWCKPCQFLESKIFTDKSIEKTINENFIPVRILDTDEKELKNFDVKGYPTLLVYDKSGKLITPITGKFIEGRYKPRHLLAKLKKILVNSKINLKISKDTFKGSGSNANSDEESEDGGCSGGSCKP